MADSSAANGNTNSQASSAAITVFQNIVTAINGLTQTVTNATPAWPIRIP
jgi:hypothetical protein